MYLSNVKDISANPKRKSERSVGPILGPMPLNISSSPSNDQLVENQGEAEEVNFKTFLLRTRGVGGLLNLF